MGNKQASSSERAGQKPSEESKNESTIPGETDESKETAIRKAEVDTDEQKMKLRKLNEDKSALEEEIKGYGMWLAQWQGEIKDPSTSDFKKKHLEVAIQRYEGWIESKNSRIKEIEGEMWSIAAFVERMVKNPLSMEKEKRHEQELQKLQLKKADQQEEIQSLTRGISRQKSKMEAEYLQQRKRFEETIKKLNEEKAKEKEKIVIYEKCLETYQDELKDPTTTERRKELESKVKENTIEVQDNKKVIENIEAELQGINFETEGNSLSIVTLHLIKWKDKSGQTQTFRLVDRVSASWRRFGTILRLAENQLEKWEDQYRGDANMCWARVMEEWLNQCSEDYPASWEGLYTLMDDAEFSQVTEELRKAVDGASATLVDEDSAPVDSADEEVVAVDVNSSATDTMDSTTTTADDLSVSSAVMSKWGRDKLQNIIKQLNEEKAKGTGQSEKVVDLERKLLGIMEAELESEGSLSIGALHLFRWKDQKRNKKTFRLVDRVSARWHKFGILLGISQNQLKAWDEQYRGNANMCWTKVMQHWLNGVGKDRYPPTWEGLYMLLEDAEYPQVAEDLKKVVDDSTAEDSSVSIPVDGVSTIPADEGTPPACVTTSSSVSLASDKPEDLHLEREKLEQLIKGLNEEKAKLQKNIEVYEEGIAEKGEDLSGIMLRQKQSILDIEGAIETEVRKKGNALSIGTLHLLKWVDEKGHAKSYRLVDKVSSKWRNIGSVCGLSPNQLDAWEHQYRGNTRKCWTRVMEHWLKGESEDYPATWEGLYDLLRDIEFSTVSLELDEAVIAACACDSGATAVESSTTPIGAQPADVSSSNSTNENDSLADDQVSDNKMTIDEIEGASNINGSTDEQSIADNPASAHADEVHGSPILCDASVPASEVNGFADDTTLPADNPAPAHADEVHGSPILCDASVPASEVNGFADDTTLPADNPAPAHADEVHGSPILCDASVPASEVNGFADDTTLPADNPAPAHADEVHGSPILCDASVSASEVNGFADDTTLPADNPAPVHADEVHGSPILCDASVSANEVNGFADDTTLPADNPAPAHADEVHGSLILCDASVSANEVNGFADDTTLPADNPAPAHADEVHGSPILCDASVSANEVNGFADDTTLPANDMDDDDKFRDGESDTSVENSTALSASIPIDHDDRAGQTPSDDTNIQPVLDGGASETSVDISPDDAIIAGTNTPTDQLGLDNTGETLPGGPLVVADDDAAASVQPALDVSASETSVENCSPRTISDDAIVAGTADQLAPDAVENSPAVSDIDGVVMASGDGANMSTNGNDSLHDDESTADDMTQHDVDQVSASELLVTMVEAKHMLETDIADLNKKRSQNHQWIADDERAISGYQRQIKDDSASEGRREELLTLVQYHEKYVQKRKILALETETDIENKMVALHNVNITMNMQRGSLMGTPGIADYSDYIFVCVLPLLCYLYYSKLHNVIIILYYLFVILTGLA